MVIRYILEAEAINRNPKRDAVVVPTLENQGWGSQHFFGLSFP
jgi:hypothetical protein